MKTLLTLISSSIALMLWSIQGIYIEPIPVGGRITNKTMWLESFGREYNPSEIHILLIDAITIGRETTISPLP